LVPEFTKPVTLKLTADDAKREALGRVLSLGGAAVGILGGVMVLRANPAAQALLKGGQAGTLTMTAKQATQDATGKALALIGTAVGAAGSVMVMAATPKMKEKFAAQFESLPREVRENKKMLMVGALGLLAMGTLYLLREQNRALVAERYQ
jgi:hypothetical protein